MVSSPREAMSVHTRNRASPLVNRFQLSSRICMNMTRRIRHQVKLVYDHQNEKGLPLVAYLHAGQLPELVAPLQNVQ